MTIKRRKSKGITITSIGPSMNQVMTLVIIAFGGGVALSYLLPKYQPELYGAFNNALGGIPDQINKFINSFHGRSYYSYPYMPVNTVHQPLY